MLDPATLRVLDSNVRDGELRWSAPPGTWRVVAIYAMPAGEAPTLVAAPQAGLVLDHFHADKVRAHYDYLLGKRTGIDAYWGAPLRGFFNDSLEFKVERHWAEGFLDEFERRRGYDLRPWLPALFVAGADNFFVSDVFGVHPEPDFGLGADADRVRWDYELTVSDLVIERFYDTSREWAAARGLLSRAQGYGMALDAIRAAGHIDIPETEALYAGGSDLFLKLASSGAHLYGRPLVSAESFVWRGAEYRTTPQKVRAAADKLFTAGVNHVVWHGTPYRVARAEGDGFGEEGWYPWSIPGATLGFSTNFSEASPFWRDAEAINRYLARAQLLLRQGRPRGRRPRLLPVRAIPELVRRRRRGGRARGPLQRLAARSGAGGAVVVARRSARRQGRERRGSAGAVAARATAAVADDRRGGSHLGVGERRVARSCALARGRDRDRRRPLRSAAARLGAVDAGGHRRGGRGAGRGGRSSLRRR